MRVREPGTGTRVRARRVAILGFHNIGEPSVAGWASWFYVPVTTFIEQLACLREGGWRVIDLATFLRGLTAPHTLPERAALLTFDDGCRSMREVTLPCLRQHGYPAVLFVPTAYIGGRNTFDTDDEPEEPMCDWADLRELERHGVSVQSHGVSHARFSELTAVRQAVELLRSRRELETGLGKAVEAFAFPYGDPGDDPAATTRMLQRTGYRAACLYGGGPNPVPVSDPYRLSRLAIGPDTDLAVALERE